MSTAAVVYVSKGGTTRRTAERIAKAFQGSAQLFELSDFLEKGLAGTFDRWILGSPTYGMGELDYRWKKFLRNLDYEGLKERDIRVGLFVMGDARKHGKTFAGSLADFAEPFLNHGIALDGRWSAGEYHFENSRAVDPEGRFPGLVLDEVSEPEKTQDRIVRWLGQLKKEATR